MSNILSSNCILTFDKKSKNTCILSTTKSDKIVFPTFRIESVKHIINETKYQIKNLFEDENIKFIEDILICTIDIQNDLYSQYIKQLGINSDYDENNDILILNSIILSDKYKTKLYWRTYEHIIDIQNKDIFGLLIDHILQKTIL